MRASITLGTEKNARKQLVSRIAEITGMEKKYMGLPTINHERKNTEYH